MIELTHLLIQARMESVTEVQKNSYVAWGKSLWFPLILNIHDMQYWKYKSKKTIKSKPLDDESGWWGGILLWDFESLVLFFFIVLCHRVRPINFAVNGSNEWQTLPLLKD